MSEQFLFSKKEMYECSCNRNGIVHIPNVSPYKERKLKFNNMHLLNDMNFSNENEFPLVKPYNGTTDFKLCPYTQRNNCKEKNVAIHFFVHDISFATQVFYQIERVTYQISKYPYVIAPDYSMFVDVPLPMNKMAVFRNRLVTAYWQNVGALVVPSCSWSDVDSLKYAFESLPQNSVIAVSGQGHHRTSGQQLLWYWAIQELELQLAPTEILIYGKDEDIPNIHTPLKFYPDYINTHFRNGRK